MELSARVANLAGGRRRGGKRAAPSRSYVVPCTSQFRDRVQALAERRRVSIGDLVRAVLYVVDPKVVDACPDPGEPAAEDREQVTLQSGPSKNRVLRRKPRLQARLPEGYTPETIRKALALALAMAHRAVAVKLTDPQAPEVGEQLRLAEAETERLRGLVANLVFQPLKDGVRTRSEALYVLGFPPNSRPDARTVKDRYRLLVRVHHPDSGFGDNLRMSQLNQAIALLQRG